MDIFWQKNNNQNQYLKKIRIRKKELFVIIDGNTFNSVESN